MGKGMNGEAGLYRDFGEADLEQALAEIGALPEPLTRYGRPTACYRGSTGFVLVTSENCVIKVVPASRGGVATGNARREIEILSRLKGCPQVVELIDCVILQDGTTCLVERRYTPLSEYIRSKPLAERDIRSLGVDICQALIHCRRMGVWHLDIQPRNLFVDGQGHAVLGDFGASAWTGELKDAGLRGTRAYMAPEVWARRDYSERSELYSLGLVLYCLLNGGAMPFSDKYDSPDEVIEARLRGEKLPPLSPEGLSRVLEKACEPAPERRWESYEQLRDALGGTVFANAAGPGAVLSGAPLAGIGAIGRAIRNALKPGRRSRSADACTPQRSQSTQGQGPDPSAATARRDAASRPMPSAPGPRFDADPYATTMAGAPGPRFDADPYATTMAGAPGPRFDADPFATTMVGVPGPRFDADPFATTMGGAPGPRFDADPYATTMVGAPGPRFDADSYATTMAGTPGPQFDADPFATTDPVGGACTGATEPPRLDRVRFSAIAPKALPVEEYSVLQVVMYEEAFRSGVDDIIASSEVPVREKRSGFVEVAQKTRVRVVLESPQFEIEDNVCEQIWYGGLASFDFAVMLPAACRQAQVIFKAVVYFDGVPAVRLMFTALRAGGGARQLEVYRRDIMSAFISYASQDRRRVAEIIQGMQKIRPDLDIFFDVNSLRSGEIWQQALEHEILSRDMLFLCWSSNARRSKWVEMEWRLALEKKGEEYIEPLPLEAPDACPPPEELSRKHFNDSLLYIINRN